ncbi:MAG: hypothetical protein KAT79_04840, partial [candidate division Zixibacteria bacterium]|nr:hypothetical protein [candidate division Zixibacteria bacterium]
MKMKLFATLAILMLLSFGTASGQTDYQLAVDSVDGLLEGEWGKIETGVPVTFYIKWINPGAPNEAKMKGYSNGFQVYSPDGATWTPITWLPMFFMEPWPPHTDVLYPGWEWLYDGGLNMNPYGVTGSGADTIGFAGYQKYGGGTPPGFEGQVFSISTQFDA